ncbi:hypothetical protein, partial [Halorhodospira halochloris]|uniref:hypothetical protein n=1 Tax=Halorhodospira halochloris TaxID=1052 RepID=UPI001EE7F277
DNEGTAIPTAESIELFAQITFPQGVLAATTTGQLLTVLPSDLHGGTTPFYLANFNADFPENSLPKPAFLPQTLRRQALSTGMAPSPRGGGIYVATTANGFGCGIGPAILYLDPSFRSVTCLVDLSAHGLG